MRTVFWSTETKHLNASSTLQRPTTKRWIGSSHVPDSWKVLQIATERLVGRQIMSHSQSALAPLTLWKAKGENCSCLSCTHGSQGVNHHSALYMDKPDSSFLRLLLLLHCSYLQYAGHADHYTDYRKYLFCLSKREKHFHLLTIWHSLHLPSLPCICFRAAA